MSSNGKLTEEKCPDCGGRVLYNGNYFCEFWSTDSSDVDCAWALSHPQTRLVDKQISWRLQGYWEVGEFIVDGEPVYETSKDYPTE